MFLYVCAFTGVKLTDDVRFVTPQELPVFPKHMSPPWFVCEVLVAQSSVFCVEFCRSFFFCFLSAIVLSVLRLISSYYPLNCSYTRHTRSCDTYQLVHHVQVYLLSNSMRDTCKFVCYVLALCQVLVFVSHVIVSFTYQGVYVT